MQLSVETTKGLERKLTIDLPEDNVTKRYEARVQQMAKEARLKGFRPGQVPVREIVRLYGEGVRQEVTTQAIQEALFEAIRKENLRVAGSPTIIEVKAEKGQPIHFVAKLEVLPELNLKDLTGVTVEKTVSTPDEKAIEKTITNLRKQRGTWLAVDRAAKNEDRVLVDFHGTLNDKAIKNGSAEKLPLVLGSNMMPTEFESELVGVKAGDKPAFDIEYPDNHPNKDIAGKKVHFTVNVHAVEEIKLPELNDEFVKALGLDKDVEGLQQEVRDALTTELESVLKNINKQKVVEKLLELNKNIEVPESLLKMEMDSLHQQAGHHHAEGETCEHHADLEKQALKRVVLGLIIGEFANKYQVVADPAKVREIVESMAMNYPKPQEVLNWYYADPKRLAPVEWMVLEDLVAEKVLATATIKEKTVGYEEVMKELQQAA